MDLLSSWFQEEDPKNSAKRIENCPEKIEGVITMPWETLELESLAEKLGLDYAEVKAKHELISKIKAVRNKHGITQVELAERLGKTQSWIAKVENGIGTKNVSFEVLFRILSILGYDYKITTRKVSDPESAAA